MHLLLATIEHSSTRFTMAMLKLDVGATALDHETEASGFFFYAHLTDDMMPRIRDAAKRMWVLTTRRDPMQIRASWLRRGLDLAGLDRQMKNYDELLAFHPKPAVIEPWGGWERLPPPYMWFDNLTREQINEQLMRFPRQNM